MIRLSKKFIRRSITGLALLAPVVYLFGSQFFTLNGAHGNSNLSADYEIVTQTYHVDFNQIVDPSSYQSITSFDNGLTTLVNPSGGNVYRHLSTPINFYMGHHYVLRLENVSRSDVNGMYFLVDDQVLNVDSSSLLVGTSNYIGRVGFVFPASAPAGSTYSAYVTLFDLTQMFGEGFEPSLNDFLRMLDDKWYPFTTSENKFLSVKEVPSFSQYLFNQFFANDNFLVHWGEDAISDSPHGFAPFGNMLQYVDNNMLHLSDLQIGLMGYGYFYYCAHVLLFVCFFDLTTFFLGWILRIAHKFGGDEYED